jgi:hypothetical protein
VHAGRQDIHDLVTRCDKSDDVQTIAVLREDRDALQRRVGRTRADETTAWRIVNPISIHSLPVT